MSKEDGLTKEFFLKEFAFIRERFKGIDEQFNRVDDRFGNIDAQFRKLHEKLLEHDDLLEIIAGEVSGTQNLLNELAPTRNDHETRITRLERGFTKLILKS